MSLRAPTRIRRTSARLTTRAQHLLTVLLGSMVNMSKVPLTHPEEWKVMGTVEFVVTIVTEMLKWELPDWEIDIDEAWNVDLYRIQ